MKSILSLLALCAVVTLSGCSNTKSNSVAPGAVGESKSGCCADKAACTDKNGTSMGAVGEKSSGCCKDAAKNGASMGAVSDKANGNCAKACPVTGKTETVSPGAVRDAKKSGGCCSGKTSG